MKTAYGILTKSDRALIAEDEGKLKYSELKAWQKRAVDSGTVRPTEWHHTSAAANITFYYDPDDFAELKPEDFPPVKDEKVEQADAKRLKIKIVFDKAVSGFTRSAKMKFEEVEHFDHPDIRKKDNRITGVNGRRLTSNNKVIEYYYLPPRCRKWRKVTKKELFDLGYKFA